MLDCWFGRLGIQAQVRQLARLHAVAVQIQNKNANKFKDIEIRFIYSTDLIKIFNFMGCVKKA